MIIDWLTIEQTFEHDLPLLGKTGIVIVDLVQGIQSDLIHCMPEKSEGSYSTSLTVHVKGKKLIVSGNPSRFNRIDNLFGHSSLDAAVQTFNVHLLSLGLPPFSKCNIKDLYKNSISSNYLQSKTYKNDKMSNGAIIKRIDITVNKAVGEGNESHYLRALAGIPFGSLKPYLYPNGKTVVWESQKDGRKASELRYPKVYEKAHEIEIHALKKIERNFGNESEEYKYLSSVVNYCKQNGVIRFELELKSKFLSRHNLNFWGITTNTDLKNQLNQFTTLDTKLQVTAMTFESITETLKRELQLNTRAANSTTLYALQWMHGHCFDTAKSQFKIHAARLNKIGINIRQPYDAATCQPVRVVQQREITVKQLSVPDWYVMPPTHGLKVA